MFFCQNNYIFNLSPAPLRGQGGFLFGRGAQPPTLWRGLRGDKASHSFFFFRPNAIALLSPYGCS
ncbi:hypothetical protein MBAV_004695 [Candidatus Magnetobacterium bavaricum]|uniref:Uncharacterized protein n=1 Tax=Candidatus Magnetobacterium bavaricum TaxID=29290 RepID=A0A0F3GMR8_9BACT|nr:hypothetical protein MBAV_004695 [Candidatus Magnetobacterium bavaricum]